MRGFKGGGRGRSVLLITGTPGTGKTTISKLLAKKMAAEYISITRLVRRYGLQSSIDRERRTKIVDLNKTRAKLHELLQGKERLVIVDTHLPDCLPKGFVKKVIVLRCDPSVLEPRLRRKGWNVGKIRENVLAELLDSCLMVAVGYYGAKRVSQLDTSRSSVRHTVTSAKGILLRPTGRETQVDWIGTLMKKDRLTRYLV